MRAAAILAAMGLAALGATAQTNKTATVSQLPPDVQARSAQVDELMKRQADREKALSALPEVRALDAQLDALQAETQALDARKSREAADRARLLQAREEIRLLQARRRAAVEAADMGSEVAK